VEGARVVAKEKLQSQRCVINIILYCKNLQLHFHYLSSFCYSAQELIDCSEDYGTKGCDGGVE
jgi:hypothetical protein